MDLSRRSFLQSTAVTLTSLMVPGQVQSAMRRLSGPVRLGLIADLHQDIMPDGEQRLDQFLEAMSEAAPDALVQMGDFAVPSPHNQQLIKTFNDAHAHTIHVLGNHDTDGGYTTQQVQDAWGMEQPYATHDVAGLRIIVLNGNEPPSDHAGGYPSYIGPEQVAWLEGELDRDDAPVVILSHQPLAGTWAIDNAEQLQQVLTRFADRILLAINGHSHIDHLLRINGVNYFHLNSASYVVVGRAFAHESFPPEVHAAYPKLASTCPYQEALFTTLTIDPANATLKIAGRQSQWRGPSPAELGREKHPDLINGEHIAPHIRQRRIVRIKSAPAPM